jgi:branched-chain amino acid transport system ATP-binding protein
VGNGDWFVGGVGDQMTNAANHAGLAIDVRDLSKAFGDFQVVRHLNFKVADGSIHALIGPNGAGKTTVFNLLTNVHAPDSGQILFRGEDITHLKPADVARRGLVRSFQISAIFPGLTVLENVRVALQRQAKLSTQFWLSDTRLSKLDQRAMELLASVKLDAISHMIAGELAYGRKRALEIATTLALDPVILLLDEPMAGMSVQESAAVTTLLRGLKRRYTILLVEHDMDAVFALADRISVLVYGRVMFTGTADEIRAHPEVRAVYLGEETN